MHNPVIKYIYQTEQYSIEDCGEFYAVLEEGWKHVASFKESKDAKEYVYWKEKE